MCWIDEHDLRWHTYKLEVAAHVIEAAFHTAPFGFEWLWQEETDDNNLHLVCRRVPWSTDLSVKHKERLLAAAASIAS